MKITNPPAGRDREAETENRGARFYIFDIRGVLKIELIAVTRGGFKNPSTDINFSHRHFDIHTFRESDFVLICR
jgi:hypothetical protein